MEKLLSTNFNDLIIPAIQRINDNISRAAKKENEMSNKLDTLIEAHEKTKILAEKANKTLIAAELKVNRL